MNQFFFVFSQNQSFHHAHETKQQLRQPSADARHDHHLARDTDNSHHRLVPAQQTRNRLLLRTQQAMGVGNADFRIPLPHHQKRRSHRAGTKGIAQKLPTLFHQRQENRRSCHRGVQHRRHKRHYRHAETLPRSHLTPPTLTLRQGHHERPRPAPLPLGNVGQHPHPQREI